MSEMTVRKMAFDFPEDMELIFIEGDPVLSYTFLGTWMLLPYLEPYLIRTMRQALPHIDDPELRAEVQGFCGQEGQHYREHARANEVIRQRHDGFGKLAAIEVEIAAEYERFSRERSLRWNLAYAEGFEAMTTAMARTQFDEGVFDEMVGPIRDLFEWHIMEELEHRTVAFEAYEAVCGGYFYRLFFGLRAQRHFMRLGQRLSQCMMAADRESFRNRRRDWGWTWRQLRFALRALPRVLSIYMQWYHPRRIRLPRGFHDARARYDAAAVKAM